MKQISRGREDSICREYDFSVRHLYGYVSMFQLPGFKSFRWRQDISSGRSVAHSRNRPALKYWTALSCSRIFFLPLFFFFFFFHCHKPRRRSFEPQEKTTCTIYARISPWFKQAVLAEEFFSAFSRDPFN